MDEGDRKWRVIQREARNDLRKVKPFMVELIGDESQSEVEEYVGVASDPSTDSWFERQERPQWDAIQKWVLDEYERRRARNVARTQHALYVPGSGA